LPLLRFEREAHLLDEREELVLDRLALLHRVDASAAGQRVLADVALRVDDVVLLALYELFSKAAM